MAFTAVVFEENDRTVAYALFCDHEDSIYLRQFFVCRDCRRRGYGREAMRILTERVWPRDKRLTVGVLSRNKIGYAFWKAVGLKDYAVELELLPSDRPSGAKGRWRFAAYIALSESWISSATESASSG